MASAEVSRGTGSCGGVKFFINGVKHSVSDKYPPDTTLNGYIRDVAGLKGTKIMCKEAGCGCCAVTVTHASDGNKAQTMSINSCVCPLYSVDGWQISTVEGIGSQKDGFHPIQERLAKYNGTQCGYCSPGFVMSMYGLLHQNPKATQQDIDDSLDGHICRCTGYRSILDAMKTFGSDSDAPEKAVDIEDLNKHLCPRTGEVCKGRDAEGNCDKGVLPQNLDLSLNGVKWYRPLSLKDLGKVLHQHKAQSVKLFFGNTSSGIYKHGGPYEVYIDLKAVAELHEIQESKNCLQVGAGTTLTKFMNTMKDMQDKPGYHYCKGVVRHLKVVASVLVRNAGCIAGNLMIKHEHPEFPSDVFTMMEAVGATLDIFDSKNSSTKKYSLVEFLNENMKGKVIVSIELPMWNATDYYRSYKITPRWQNAHAYVNAAFKIPVENRQILAQPNLVFGGISPDTVHASETEAFLNGKTLSDETVSEALSILASELHPKAEPLIASPKYRLELATNLLYKALLEVYKPTQYKIQSGGDSMERPLSSGFQSYQEKTEEFPMKQPLPKKTAPLQASGEAEYINDIPTYQQELTAAMVISNISRGSIKDVDPSAALNIPGVVKYIGPSDIPKDGVNNHFPHHPLLQIEGELFASKEIEYGGQMIGIVLAETQALAEEGASKVKVTYENVQTPIVDLEDAIAQNTIYEDKGREHVVGDPEEALKNAAFVVEGEIKEGTQAHFYMENQVALSVPSEDGLDIYSATQIADLVHKTVALVIGKPLNFVNVYVPRLGGSFGGKSLQSAALASAIALGSYITGKPVRLNVDLSSNMRSSSKRFPIYVKYKAGCDANGKMQALDIDICVDSGCKPSGAVVTEIIAMCDQGYHCPNWRARYRLFKTDKPMAAACRGPGSVPGSLTIETIMEHLAKKVGQHPILFKELNLYEAGQTDHQGKELTNCTLRELWNRLKQTAEISARMEDVKRFNQNNLWRKRGITMCSVKYHIGVPPLGHPTQVSVFAGDGTVTVITAGVEMGQGLYMKVAQAVAKTLNVPVNNVKVRPNQNNVSPNGFLTGGSTGSESCVASAIAACDAINERLQPLREKMGDAGWVPLLNAAVFSGIPLLENTMAKYPNGLPNYFTYMAGATETEVDVLTGEYQVKRVDIMADFGESLNPTIDIGQVEGAYVMGLGTFLTEDVYFDPSNGVVLNDGTWEYKPPTTKDIPIDWRIHFLPDSPNPNGILSSKATGEPAIGLSVGALLSIKSAVEDAREDLTNEKIFLPVEAPFTVEKAQQGSGIGIHHLKVNGATD